MPRISSREWRRVIILALILIALSYVPFHIGFQSAPAGQQFEGFFINGVDNNTYLAAMQQGMQGHWLFHLLYTSEDHHGSLIYVFYVGLGHLADRLGASALGVFHGVRLLSGALLLMAEFVFIASFVTSAAIRWIAYLFVACSSGLGWLVLLVTGSTALWGLTPIDFWLTDAYTLFTLIHAPHFCLALACLLMLFVCILAFFANRRRRAFVCAALSALGLALFNPYLLLVAGGVLATYWCFLALRRRAWPWLEAGGLVGLSLILTPPVAVYYLTLQSDPVWTAFAGQDLTVSPPPVFYVLGFGLLTILMLPGVLWVARNGHEKEAFLVTWVVVIAIAIYLPFNLQLRMITGLQVPIGLLSSIGLVRYVMPAVRRCRPAQWLEQAGYPPRRFRVLALNLIIVLSLPSNLYLLLSMAASASAGHPELFRSVSEVEAIDWLGVHSEPSDTVLASYRTGNFLPARIGHRVFLGHWDETVDYRRKKALVEAFFCADNLDTERTALLRDYDIAYVFWGPHERRLGDFQPDQAPYLAQVFGNGIAGVYHVELALPSVGGAGRALTEGR